MTLDSREILDTVCQYYGLEPKQMFRYTREREIVEPRYMYYHFARKYSVLSFADIGRTGTYYGCRKNDHATVLHAKNKITDLIEVDKRLKNQYNEIETLLRNKHSRTVLCEIIPNSINLLTLAQRNLYINQ